MSNADRKEKPWVKTLKLWNYGHTFLQLLLKFAFYLRCSLLCLWRPPPSCARTSLESANSDFPRPPINKYKTTTIYYNFKYDLVGSLSTCHIAMEYAMIILCQTKWKHSSHSQFKLSRVFPEIPKITKLTGAIAYSCFGERFRLSYKEVSAIGEYYCI